MNLIKIFILFLMLQTPLVWAQQNNVKPQVPVNVTPVSPTNPGTPAAVNPGQVLNQPVAPKKEKTEQILIDPFSGSASTASIDVNTNPDLANFVDQTLVGVIVGETKRIAVLQSAQGQINRFRKNEKINSEYKILEIYKDKILVASLDNNEYEVYFNNVIKPVEKKKPASNKPIKLEQQLENSLDQNVDPLAPKLAPKKQAPVKKITEPKSNTKKNKKPESESVGKEESIIKENTTTLEIDEEELKQMKITQEEEKRQIRLIQEEEKKELQKSLIKTKKENTKKPNIKKEKEKGTIDDSYNPDLEPKIIREDSDLNKSQIEKVSDIDVEKIKEKLKK